MLITPFIIEDIELKLDRKRLSIFYNLIFQFYFVNGRRVPS